MTDTGRSDLETQLLVEMVDSVGVGVAIYGDDGRYRYVNQAYADMLGTDRESLTGRALWEVVSGFERDRFEGYWNSFAERETRVRETEHVFDGAALPVSTVTTRRRIAGDPYNFGTIRDITDRKRREQELKDKNERLEAFAGIVSHDLRNPLSVAKGYLELLRSDVDNDEIELIESALDRMDILIEDLLTLAREGRSVSDSEEVSLSDVAADAWRQIEASGATLDTGPETTVLADPNRLQQLLENLFRNSIDHTDGPVSVRVGGPRREGGLFRRRRRARNSGIGAPTGVRTDVLDGRRRDRVRVGDRQRDRVGTRVVGHDHRCRRPRCTVRVHRNGLDARAVAPDAKNG